MHYCNRWSDFTNSWSCLKLAFHGANTVTDMDTDTDSPNTAAVLYYVRHTLFPSEDPREEVGEDVSVAFHATDSDTNTDTDLKSCVLVVRM